jgi:Peptidase family M48
MSWLALASTFAPASIAQKEKLAIDRLVDRITARERQEVQDVREYRPLIETYVQDIRLDRNLGFVPIKDHYFIGIANLAEGVVLHSMEGKAEPKKRLNPINLLAAAVSPRYIPAGFLEMIFIDPTGFDRRHYRFEYLRRESLGDVRCLVFDITPAPNSGIGRFKGRIWVEDEQYTVVRFSGVFEPVVRNFGFNLHFDSWRENAGPGLWLPTYIYNGEEGLSNNMFGHVSEKSQTRLWGYARKNAVLEEEFTEIKVESSNVKDETDQSKNSSPVEQQRQFVKEGEERVLARLERSALLSPSADVEKMLDAVINNIQITNNLDIQPEIHCRILLVSPLELSSIGHTIVISRGLLDVLPDEASLAAMLAHEMAHILLGRSEVPTWAFADQAIFPDEESLQRFPFSVSEEDERAVNRKALELMKNSSYKDKLDSAGLFLRQIDAKSKQLTSLISPHLRSSSFFDSELVRTAPALQPTAVDQIAALPLGSKIKVDPWNDHAEMLGTKPNQLSSLPKELPLAVIALYPFLTRRVAPVP